MKCKKMTIETDGTTANTKIMVDGRQLSLIRNIEFSASLEDTFIKVLVQKAVEYEGGFKKRKLKLRDEETQKLVEKEEIVTEPILIEFEN